MIVTLISVTSYITRLAHTESVCTCVAMRFYISQPTGMLIVGDALFVAGEHDMMVFNLGASDPAVAVANLPLVATCGAACARVGDAGGQNFHSVAYKLMQFGSEYKHMVFISAQIDNNVGAVEIIDPEIISLLKRDGSI